jgi:hypothetical protein
MILSSLDRALTVATRGSETVCGVDELSLRVTEEELSS